MVEIRRHLALPGGFLMVLRQGDEVLDALAALMRENRVPSASFVGFGFVSAARFGFFDFGKGEYAPKTFHEIEITGCTGTLAWKEGEPSVHAHASGADRSFRAVGGHVLGLTVGRGSFEITVTVHPMRLERRLEPEIGANVLQLSDRR